MRKRGESKILGFEFVGSKIVDVEPVVVPGSCFGLLHLLYQLGVG